MTRRDKELLLAPAACDGENPTMAGRYAIDGRWTSSDEGQCFTASAVTHDGRVIARAMATISLTTMQDMDDALGGAGRIAVENSVYAACERLAEAFPT